MLDDNDDLSTTGYWPSVADLFMTLFVITVAILAVVFFTFLPKNNHASDQKIIMAVGSELENIRKPTNQLRKELHNKTLDEGVIDLPQIRSTESPQQVIDGLKDTCEIAVKKIKELEKKIDDFRDVKDGYVKVHKEEIRKPVNKLRFQAGMPLLAENESPNRIVKELEVTANDISEILQKQKEKTDLASAWHLWYTNNLDLELTDINRNKGRELKAKVANVGVYPVIDGLIKDLETQRSKNRPNDKPPIITVPDGEVEFAQSEAKIDPKDVGKLKNVFANVIKQLERFKEVNTLEIVGHTDTDGFKRAGNFDQKIAGVLKGGPLAAIVPGSNADLGLMRALAIKKEWERWLKERDWRGDEAVKQRFLGIDVRCYSAAQTIPPVIILNEKPEDFKARARRIEIRFTQIKKN